MDRLFLLSPASCSGARARMLVRPEAAFDLAVRLRAGQATLGEAMAFTSGLYFRGKLAYAQAFARPPAGVPGALVVTTCDGLVDADAPTGVDTLLRYGTVDIDPRVEAYAGPLRRHARALGDAHPRCEFVLLGSLATRKYVPVLAEALGDRLRFPTAFVGQGDMRRGAMMLRAAREGRELDYAPATAAPVR